jgi:hypothetical protein
MNDRSSLRRVEDVLCFRPASHPPTRLLWNLNGCPQIGQRLWNGSTLQRRSSVISQVSDRRSSLSSAEGEQILHSWHLPMGSLHLLRALAAHLRRSARREQAPVSAHAFFRLRPISAKRGLLPYISICTLNSFADTKSPAAIGNTKAPILIRICQTGMSDTPSRSMT